METYTNDKGEEVVIAEMEAQRLIHAIAKYSRKVGGAEALGEDGSKDNAIVTALKAEAVKRLTQNG